MFTMMKLSLLIIHVVILNLQVASFLLYLSNVEEGGETMFPFEVDKEIPFLSFFFCLFLCRTNHFVAMLTSNCVDCRITQIRGLAMITKSV